MRHGFDEVVIGPWALTNSVATCHLDELIIGGNEDP
jgi:hypothetical protein